MGLDPKTLQAWAKGRLSNGDGGEDLPDEPEDEGAEDTEATPEKKEVPALWAGTYEGDIAEVTPEEATELLTWLEESEPEIFESMNALVTAIAEGDDDALGSATDALLFAEQATGDDFEEEQRQEVVTALQSELESYEMPAVGSDEANLSVAVALGRARMPKKLDPKKKPPPSKKPPPDDDDDDDAPFGGEG